MLKRIKGLPTILHTQPKRNHHTVTYLCLSFHISKHCVKQIIQEILCSKDSQNPSSNILLSVIAPTSLAPEPCVCYDLLIHSVFVQ